MLLLTLCLSLPSVAAPGVEVRTLEHDGDRFRVVSLDLHEVRIELVGQAPGEPHTFEALQAGEPDLLAATNAGIFHTAAQPVGLHVQGHHEHSPVERADGRGNFYWQPNGVFWIDGSGAHVSDTGGFEPHDGVRLATQSGPALVLGGTLHPDFVPGSEHRKVRSAVGVSDPWTVHWVVSDGPTGFHELASVLRDDLHARDALYLDGTISGLLAAGLPSPPTHAYSGLLVATARAPAEGLRDGDLVFQRSASHQAAAIAAATGSEWTHMGLVRLVDGAPFVLEAVQPVKLTPYHDWVDRGVGDRVAVRRLAEAESAWTPEALARLDALQTGWIGRPYDARFGWGDEQLYCSELVHKAVERATGMRLTPLRPLSAYEVDDPLLQQAIRHRWGSVPEDLQVVAPSDLYGASGVIEVSP